MPRWMGMVGGGDTEVKMFGKKEGDGEGEMLVFPSPSAFSLECIGKVRKNSSFCHGPPELPKSFSLTIVSTAI